jgi:hypothetical protein
VTEVAPAPIPSVPGAQSALPALPATPAQVVDAFAATGKLASLGYIKLSLIAFIRVCDVAEKLLETIAQKMAATEREAFEEKQDQRPAGK